MKLVIDKFKVTTSKEVKKPFRVVVLADLHVGESFLNAGAINLRATMRGVQKIKEIDLIVVVGDLVNNAQSFKVPRVMKSLQRFLTGLGKIAPVLVVNGNHDLYMGSERTRELYESLGELAGVEILDNKQKVVAPGIMVTGFSPRHGAYGVIRHGKLARMAVVKDYLASGLEFDAKKFNIVLTHSPYSLTNKRVMKKLPEIYEGADVVLSGHLHNGLLISRNVEFLRRYFNGLSPNSVFGRTLLRSVDKGFCLVPKTIFMIGLCRGARLVGGGKVGRCVLPSSKEYAEINLGRKHRSKLVQITTKGVNKFSMLSGVLTRPSVVELLIEKTKK